MVRSMVDKLTFGQLFLPVLLFPLSVSFHHCSILAAITRRTNGRRLGTFQKSSAVFGNRGASARKYFHLVFYVIFCTRLTCRLSPLGFGPFKFSAAPFLRRWLIRWPMSRSLSSVLNMVSLFIWFRLGACKLRGLRRGNKRRGGLSWNMTCVHVLFVRVETQSWRRRLANCKWFKIDSGSARCTY